MGIPYSRQIRGAFDQVTPLVASGFEVLQTTKNISLLLAEIQILTVVILIFALFALLALLITCNPDLEHERKVLITPAMRWLASWMMSREGKMRFSVTMFFVVLGVALVVYAHWFWYFKNVQPVESADKEVATTDVSEIDDGTDVVEGSVAAATDIRR